MITFACSGCGQKLRVTPEQAGKQMRCPRCQQVGPIPAAPPAADPVATPPPASEVPTVSAPPSGPSTHDFAHPGDSPPRKELVDFLAPPQAADELGRLGGYRVLKVLGQGGMGVVFLAEDPTLKRVVALKVMLPVLAATESNRQRFLQEAQAAAALEHDRVIHIYQVGEDRGVPYLAMPFLKGEPLDQRLKREEVLPTSEVLRIGREIAEGLAAAHDKGLMHRDIKPANVWLEAPLGRVKILDFGLARAVTGGSHLTQTGAILGTPAYMAPEQARGKAVDGRCDLFSLGCVLYQMSTGQLPFVASDTIATLMAVATEEPPPPDEVNPDVPPALADLVLDLLAKRPEDRPASAVEVIEIISRIEDDRLEPLPEPARRRRSRVIRAEVADEEEDVPDPEVVRKRARRLVAGPAIGLIVAGSVGIAFPVLSLVPLLGVGMANATSDSTFLLGFGLIGQGLSLLWGIAVLAGGLRMMKLKNYGLCLAITFFTLLPVPCIGGCCSVQWLLGLGFGIWALVILCRLDVREAFR